MPTLTINYNEESSLYEIAYERDDVKKNYTMNKQDLMHFGFEHLDGKVAPLLENNGPLIINNICDEKLNQFLENATVVAELSLVEEMLKSAGCLDDPKKFQTWAMGDPSAIAMGVEPVHAKTGDQWLHAIQNANSGGFSCGESSQSLFDRLTTGHARVERLIGPKGGSTGDYAKETQLYICKALKMIDKLKTDLKDGKMARITSGPHSFMIEPLSSGMCRFHQTYDAGGNVNGGFDLDKSVKDGEPFELSDFISWFKGEVQWNDLSASQRSDVRSFRQKHFFNHSVDPTGGLNNRGGLSIDIETRNPVSKQEAQRVGEQWRGAIQTRIDNLRGSIPYHAEQLGEILNGFFSNNPPQIPAGNVYERMPYEIGKSLEFYHAQSYADASAILHSNKTTPIILGGSFQGFFATKEISLPQQQFFYTGSGVPDQDEAQEKVKEMLLSGMGGPL